MLQVSMKEYLGVTQSLVYIVVMVRTCLIDPTLIIEEYWMHIKGGDEKGSHAHM